MPPEIALGFRVHSGWAAMVAVSGSPLKPAIVDRRRIQIAEAPTQPYHAARDLGAVRGAAFLDEYRKASQQFASASLEAAIKQIGGDRIRTCTVLTGSGRPSPTLEATLASHAAIHTAEGEFFRELVLQAAESCGLRVHRIREKDLFALAERKFAQSSAVLHRMLDDQSKILGPPWQQDQKLASLAAWLSN